MRGLFERAAHGVRGRFWKSSVNASNVRSARAWDRMAAVLAAGRVGFEQW